MGLSRLACVVLLALAVIALATPGWLLKATATAIVEQALSLDGLVRRCTGAHSILSLLVVLCVLPALLLALLLLLLLRFVSPLLLHFLCSPPLSSRFSAVASCSSF